MSEITGLILTVVLLGANAFFVGAEFALISARRTQIEPRAEENGIAHLTGSMGVQDGMVADYRLTLIAKRLAQNRFSARSRMSA